MLADLSQNLVDWAQVVGAGVAVIALIVAAVSVWQAASSASEAKEAADASKAIAENTAAQLQVVRDEAAAAAEERAKAPELQVALHAMRGDPRDQGLLHTLDLAETAHLWVQVSNVGQRPADYTTLRLAVQRKDARILQHLSEGPDLTGELQISPFVSADPMPYAGHWTQARQWVTVPAGESLQFRYIVAVGRARVAVRAEARHGADPNGPAAASGWLHLGAATEDGVWTPETGATVIEVDSLGQPQSVDIDL